MPATAQDQLRIAAIVNDDIVSAYDLDKRIDLVLASSQIPNTTENRQRVRDQVLRGMIDERLQAQEAKKRNINIPQSDIDASIRRIEQQNNVPPGRFDDFVRSVGIDKDTLLAQLRAEQIWARIMRGRIMPQVNVSDEEIRTALERMEQSSGKTEKLVSEILVAVDSPDQEDEARRNAERTLDQLRADPRRFAQVARQFSQGITAAAGGEVGWVLPGSLPEEIDAEVQRLQPGQLSDLIRGPGGFSIVMVRDERRVVTRDISGTTVKLREILMPSDPSGGQQGLKAAMELAKTVAETVQGCADAEKLAGELGASSADLGTVKFGEMPRSLQRSIETIKAGNASEPFASERGVVVLVVCERQDAEQTLNTEAIRESLTGRKANLLARRYLRDLRRDATIEFR